MSDKQEEMLIKLAKYFKIDPDDKHRNEAISSALLKLMPNWSSKPEVKKRAGGISVDYRKRSGGLFNRMGKK